MTVLVCYEWAFIWEVLAIAILLSLVLIGVMFKPWKHGSRSPDEKRATRSELPVLVGIALVVAMVLTRAINTTWTIGNWSWSMTDEICSTN